MSHSDDMRDRFFAIKVDLEKHAKINRHKNEMLGKRVLGKKGSEDNV